MGAWRAVKDFLGIEESEYDEDFDNEGMYSDEYEDDVIEERFTNTSTNSFIEEEEDNLSDTGIFGNYGRSRSSKKNDRYAPERQVNSNSANNRMSGFTNSGNLKVVVCNPTEYDNCEVICRHLLSNMSVVLNLETLKGNKDKIRIFDFVAGCCFALGGHIKKISEHVYLAVPSSVDILAESELKGVQEYYEK